MAVITANDLKTKGISDIEHILQDAQEVVISVRGKPRYVVMDVTRYDVLRECEIVAAWAQTQKMWRRDAIGKRVPMRIWRASRESWPMSYSLIFTESMRRSRGVF